MPKRDGNGPPAGSMGPRNGGGGGRGQAPGQGTGTRSGGGKGDCPQAPTPGAEKGNG